MQQYDPARLRRVQRDVRWIFVWGTPGWAGHWVDELRMCQVSHAYIMKEETTPAHVARVIVHEATHARLCRAGIRYLEPQRDRIERICRRQELEFVRRLPDAEHLVTDGEERTAVHTGEYSNEGLFQHQATALNAAMDADHWPRWAKRLVNAILRRRARRAGWGEPSN